MPPSKYIIKFQGKIHDRVHFSKASGFFIQGTILKTWNNYISENLWKSVSPIKKK